MLGATGLEKSSLIQKAIARILDVHSATAVEDGNNNQPFNRPSEALQGRFRLLKADAGVDFDSSIASDSGYESMSARMAGGSINSLSRKYPLDEKSNWAALHPVSNHQAHGDEIVSLASDTKDTGSQKITTIPPQHKQAEELIAALLFSHLSEFLEKALENIAFPQLLQNVRRLLKLYYLDLLPLAVDELKKATVNVLRAKSSRNRIALEFIRSIALSSINSARMNDEAAQDQIDNKKTLEAWIDEQQNFANTKVFGTLEEKGLGKGEGILDDDGKVLSDFDDESDDAGANGTPFPRISEMNAFLFEGRPFENLVTRALAFLMPIELQSLQRAILSLPEKNVWFRKEDDSVTDRVKRYVESQTLENWNWWPLAQMKQPLLPDEVRMHWKCVS